MVRLQNLMKEAAFVRKFGTSEHFEALKTKTKSFDANLWHANAKK